MSTQAAPSDDHLHPATAQADVGSLSRLGRQLSQSAKGYFSKRDKATPTTPSQSSTPSTPAVGDVIGSPTPLQRFLSVGKPRKGGNAEFPPSHWGTSEQDNGTDISGIPMLVLADEPASPEHLADPAVTDPSLSDSIDAPPEPLTLAQRIQVLLSRTTTTSEADGPAHENLENANSESTSHPPPALVTDSKLITLLSSPAVMNGTLSKSGQSVWAVLDKLRSQLPGQNSTTGASTAESGAKAEEPPLEDDDSGVMIYGPLIPNADSQVELARSEDIEDDSKAEKTEIPASAAKPGALDNVKGKLEEMWPFKVKEDSKQAEAGDTTPSVSRVYFQPVQSGKAKRRWIPSPDKISIQVNWWGYRIYLPPPVLDILDNKQLEGAKRAAMLTAALKWALDRVPLVMIPLPARPAMRLLKAFTPYLGYVGGFVAWSWGAVKTFDKGHGVTLTATWLLTVAVIPGTWEEKDFPTDVAKTMPQATAGGNDSSSKT